MRILRFLLQKEFKQIFRNPIILAVLFVLPIVQLLFLPFAADSEIKDIEISIVDNDHSDYSQKLISKITSSDYFRLVHNSPSYKKAFKDIENKRSDLVLEIPSDFEKDLVREDENEIFIAVNAINGTKANLGSAYLNQILMDYNDEVRLDWQQPSKFNQVPSIAITSSNWFNRLLDYNFYMVPGILVQMITVIIMFMSALNIVKEQEMGTIEQINVTPIKKHQFILGKIIPFWLLGMGVFTVGLFGVARPVFGIVSVGSIGLLYLYLAVYLIAMLGMGLLISTSSQTQQQAMSVSFFFILIFLLMSGLFTPIESMPGWAQFLARINPVTYFTEVMWMIVLKGSGFGDIQYHFYIIIGFAIVLNLWAIRNYRKTA